MKKIFLCLLFLTTQAKAASTTLLIQHPQMDKLDFAAHILTRASDSEIAYSTYLNENLEPEYLKTRLRDSFTRAQENFLKEDLNILNKNWNEVIAFSYKANWSKVNRDLIAYAYLRAAQVARDQNQGQELINQAYIFHPEYNVDKKLLPPPIVSAFDKLKSQAQRDSVVTNNLIDYDFLILNGKTYDLKSTVNLRLPKGMYFLTLTSSAYKPINKVIHSENISNYKPHKQPIFTGVCNEQDKIDVAKEVRNQFKLAVIEPTDCKVIAPPLAQTSTDLLPQSSVPHIENKVNLDDRAFYQKPQFWVGVALVSAAVLILNREQESDQNRSPTVKKGF